MHEAGTAGPGVGGSRLGEYRYVADIGMLGSPFLRQPVLVQVDLGLGAPKNEHRALAIFGNGMLDDGLDRCEAGAAGEQDHRLGRILAQVEAAVWAVETQDVTHLHGREHLVGELAARYVADMQLQQRIVVRRIGQRETALLAVLEQDVDILAGEELQAFAGRQAQVQLDDVRRQAFQFFDARGQGFDRDLRARGDLLALNDQVGLRLGAAIKRQAGGFFVVLQGVRLGLAVVYAAGLDMPLAGAAGAVLAAVRHGQALAQCGVEYGFVGLGHKLAAAWLDGDLVAHRFPFVLGYNAGVQKILIVGSGDVARRILSQLAPRAGVYALLRDAGRAAQWRAAGAMPVLADLDDRSSLERLAGLADCVLHLAPPPGSGTRDTRTRNLLAALSKGKSLPRSLIYVSTTGVYGECGGAAIDETRFLNPESSRAGRRVDAEQVLRAWVARHGVAVSILRAPGIYAADRLPVERLQKGVPALVEADDVYTNHIHADDLATACIAALRRGKANRAYNVGDDSDLKMAEHFDLVAQAFDLPKAPRLSRAEAEKVLSPVQMSFMRESRRIGNRRLKHELKLQLAYPTVVEGIASARRNTCSS